MGKVEEKLSGRRVRASCEAEGEKDGLWPLCSDCRQRCQAVWMWVQHARRQSSPSDSGASGSTEGRSALNTSVRLREKTLWIKCRQREILLTDWLKFIYSVELNTISPRFAPETLKLEAAELPTPPNTCYWTWSADTLTPGSVEITPQCKTRLRPRTSLAMPAVFRKPVTETRGGRKIRKRQVMDYVHVPHIARAGPLSTLMAGLRWV
ncbi:hypothetical protein B0H14DRAFT_3645180 [Mycena olivaceomarginata]|nr:hypothetical protein B0H14DRAFT_3645180 [Mycena olivaceomarginata]